jgi:hypothetical protein
MARNINNQRPQEQDALAKTISIAGGLSAISLAVSGGSRGGLSEIIGG